MSLSIITTETTGGAELFPPARKSANPLKGLRRALWIDAATKFILNGK
ncbi:hypothetical protein OS035_03925 [Rhizobium sp. 268]|jgi:hypothetical protein|nr:MULTISPECIES: hypothetical protein [unclassified Rhizobium]MBB3523385.1 hypothetical protein [Rhizobium sp. BK456]MBY4590237.1 hypothetical protein [Rhizobium redzepovicii]MBY4612965.1 hypothetical protein [Rhizobium redzepovicii]ULJ82376.1 hypothetical protein MF410_29040 [Rhizobium sp. C104]